MKRICGLLLSGICLLLGVLETRAQDVITNSVTTNFWVQNVNAALTAYVQSGGSVISGTLPSKQLLTFLSGVTNLINVLETNNNFTVTNRTVEVTNSSYLPPTNFPPEYDLNTNYVVSGLTNNAAFTNDIVFTQTSTNPVTYTFTNLVELPNGHVGYLFPSLQVNFVTAVQSTNSDETNVIFDLTGVVTNNSPTYTFDVFPDFSKQRGAKLIYVTPIQHLTETILTTVTNGASVITNSVVTNLPPQQLTSLYMVRYSNGRTVTNVDVSNCFHEFQYTQPAVSSYGSAQLTQASYSLGEIRFETTFDYYYGYAAQTGAKIDLIGFDFQTRGVIFSKGKVISSYLPKTRKLSGGGDGQVNGQISTKTFNQASTVYSGSISFSVGHLESSL